MSGRRVVRAGVAAIVLFGLFLMHGAPASAAEGCHGGPMPAMSATTAEAHHDPVTAGNGTAVDDPGAPGETCVATAPHERIHLPVPGLLAVVLIVAAVRAAARTPRRGPPPRSGRPLLLQVCIART